MATVATLKTRIGDAVNRSDLTSYVDTWLEAAHRHYQRYWNWDCMKKDYRVLASTVTYSFTAPTDVKEPRFLCRVAGTDTGVPLVPSAGNTLQTPFYLKTDFEEIIALRASLLEKGRENDQTIRRRYAYDNGVIQLVPKNDISDDHFAFAYYGFLDLPADASSDWFTNNMFDVLLYRALLESLPFLGEADDRALIWKELLVTAEKGVFGHGISLEYGGESLVMRG